MAKQKKRRLKKPYRILRGIYATIVVIAALIVVGYGVYKIAVPPPAIPQTPAPDAQTAEVGTAPNIEASTRQRKDQTYTFLLACPDRASGNADAIMVVTYDVPNQKIGMLSIPRDTLVNEPKPKINATYHAGVDNLKRVVSELVGFPLDFYISIDLEGFVELVDAVGGIDFNVPVEMYYNDPAQDLNIFYHPGMQHLNGQQTMEVCRFRHNADGTGYPLGDIQRSETLRNVMVTVAKKIVSWSSISRVNDFLDILERNIDTNLTATNLAWFASQAMGLNLNTGITGNALPGDGNVTYKGTKYCYELYPEQCLDMINATVNPYLTSLTLQDLNIFQAP